MPRVRWFVVPSVIAPTPTEREWFWTPDAIISSSGDLAQLVLTEAGLPPTTALWLQTGWPLGWQRVSSLAKVPSSDLVVKAVVGQPGEHVVCIAGLNVMALCYVNGQGKGHLSFWPCLSEGWLQNQGGGGHTCPDQPHLVNATASALQGCHATAAGVCKHF